MISKGLESCREASAKQRVVLFAHISGNCCDVRLTALKSGLFGMLLFFCWSPVRRYAVDGFCFLTIVILVTIGENGPPCVITFRSRDVRLFVADMDGLVTLRGDDAHVVPRPIREGPPLPKTL